LWSFWRGIVFVIPLVLENCAHDFLIFLLNIQYMKLKVLIPIPQLFNSFGSGLGSDFIIFPMTLFLKLSTISGPSAALRVSALSQSIARRPSLESICVITPVEGITVSRCQNFQKMVIARDALPKCFEKEGKR